MQGSGWNDHEEITNNHLDNNKNDKSEDVADEASTYQHIPHIRKDTSKLVKKN